MSCRIFGAVAAPLLLVLPLAAGCNSNEPATVENKLHDTKQFSAEQLNAPLSAQAKARGAQVAPPPTR